MKPAAAASGWKSTLSTENEHHEWVGAESYTGFGYRRDEAAGGAPAAEVTHECRTSIRRRFPIFVPMYRLGVTMGRARRAVARRPGRGRMTTRLQVRVTLERARHLNSTTRAPRRRTVIGADLSTMGHGSATRRGWDVADGARFGVPGWTE